MVDLSAETDTATPAQSYGRRVVTESATLSTGLPKKGTQRNAPFFWKFKQSRWMWIDDRGSWYPNLGFVNLTPGAGGMSSAKGSWADAVRETENRKWHVIRWEDARLGKFQNYCVEYPLAKGGSQYVSMFHAPDVLDDDNEWQRDDEAYYGFLDFLVEAKIVPKRTKRMCRQPIRKQESRINRLFQDLTRNPGSKLTEARYRGETKKLARMTDEDVNDALAKAESAIEAVREAGLAEGGEDE